MKLKIINLFAGPCSGKSTIAAELFSKMKMRHMSVELVTEFAKDLVWEEQHGALNDQLFILASQNRRLTRLLGKVEYVVTDSPILMNLVYAPKYYLPNTYRNLVEEVNSLYDNRNFFLVRDFPYVKVGRTHTEEQALKKDVEILNLLSNHRYLRVDSNSETSSKILDEITSNW